MKTIIIVILLLIAVVLIYNFYDNFNTSINGRLLSRVNNKLKSVSNDKIINVKGVETKLIPETIDLRTKLDLDFITQTIISKLNCAEFNFIKTSYDRVTKNQTKNQRTCVREFVQKVVKQPGPKRGAHEARLHFGCVVS